MSFIWPTLLLTLFCIPLLILLYWRMQGQRRKFAARFGSLGLVHDAKGSGVGLRRHIPATIFLGGISILVFSLARPQATVSVPKIEGTVILTFDVSGSMAATDFQPTRMEAAKAAARQFVENQPSGVSIGVVVFSDGGISVQPPTNQRDETIATIDRLVPRRGTSVGNGILVALNTIVVDAGDPPILNTTDLSQPPDSQAPSPTPIPAPQGWYPSAAIVLLTDGENNETPDPSMAADLAANLGVRVYTVGIGSPAGADLEVEGFKVHTSLDEATLQMISSTTGGVYYNAGDEQQLRKIYADLKPKLSIKPEQMELTSIFAGFGMIIFLLGGMLSLLWFGHVP
ncbi:MAG TPA: VWA domain-containing protein [Anaerolineales bacterium]|nr:VWA domain-containing protein [Anaerolineales bacterium]